MRMLISLLLFAAASVHGADDLATRSGAAKNCARELMRSPMLDGPPGQVIITYGESLFHGAEEYLAIRFSGAAIPSMQFLRATVPYYGQCADFYKEHPAALLDADAHREIRRQLSYELWRFPNADCAAIKTDLAGLSPALHSNAERAGQLLIPRPAKSTEAPTTIVVRADGPVYRLRLSVDFYDQLDIRPGIATDLEILVETLLKHARECAAKRPPNQVSVKGMLR